MKDWAVSFIAAALLIGLVVWCAGRLQGVQEAAGDKRQPSG
jgi:hypothetical protein